MTPSLGRFEELILFALISLDDGAYGAAIGREIEGRTGRTISTGALYTVLDRLETRGLLSSWIGEPRAERGGRRRKYYRLEAAGVATLRRSHEELKRMTRGLGNKLAALSDT